MGNGNTIIGTEPFIDTDCDTDFDTELYTTGEQEYIYDEYDEVCEGDVIRTCDTGADNLCGLSADTSEILKAESQWLAPSFRSLLSHKPYTQILLRRLETELTALDQDIDYIGDLCTEEQSKLAKKFVEYERVLYAIEAAIERGDLDTANEQTYDKVRGIYLDLKADLVWFDRGGCEATFGLDNDDEVKRLRTSISHTYESPIVGKKARLLETYREFALANPAFLRFGHALYYENPNMPGIGEDETPEGIAIYKIIPLKDKAEADRIAKQRYEEYCDRNGVDPELQVYWHDVEDLLGITWIYDPENDSSAWTVGPIVYENGFITTHGRREYYLPAYNIALHELGHVERIKPFEPRRYHSASDDSIIEIGTTINDIINLDEIYKEIHGISLDRVVRYPEHVPTNTKRGLNVGLIANTFRKLKAEYGSIEAALMTDEGLAFVTTYYQNENS